MKDMESNYSDFVDYLEKLAESHAEIRHDPNNGRPRFMRMDLDEPDNSIKQLVGFPFIAVDGYAGRLAGEPANLVQRKGITIMILDHISDRKDYKRVYEIYDRTEAIAKDFIFRIYQDMLDGNAPDIVDFNLNEVEIEQASNVSLSLFGTIITFPIVTRVCAKPRAGMFE